MFPPQLQRKHPRKSLVRGLDLPQATKHFPCVCFEEVKNQGCTYSSFQSSLTARNTPWIVHESDIHFRGCCPVRDARVCVLSTYMLVVGLFMAAKHRHRRDGCVHSPQYRREFTQLPKSESIRASVANTAFAGLSLFLFALNEIRSCFYYIINMDTLA